MSERHTIARTNLDGENFEVIVKPEPAFSYRSGKTTSISGVLVAETIFSDASKGMKASEEKMRKAFGTSDNLKIAEQILKKGTLQLTTEQRRRMIEEKRKQIVDFISRNAVDPRTKLPHPPTRIEQAMGQIHYSIDPFRGVEEQSNEVIKLLRPIIPLTMEKITVVIQIPAQYAARVYGLAKGFGTIKKEEWRPDGSWSGFLEMPSGSYASFLDKLGGATKGTLEAKVV